MVEPQGGASRGGIVLVTGAGGYIARALIRRLAASGERVRATTRSAAAADIAGGDVMAVGELGPDTDWSRALAGVDRVIHLAGIAHVPHKADAVSGARYDRVNHLGSRRLFEMAAAAGVRRVVLVSSILVNGPRSGPAPFREASPAAPAEAYSASKLAAERALAEVAAAGAIEWAVVRPPMVYGPGAPGNMGRLIRLVRTRLPLPLGRADARRSFIGVDNLVSALEVVANHPAAAGKLYLVSDGEDVSVAEAVRLIAELAGFRARLLPVSPAALRAAARLVGAGPIADRLLDPLIVDSGAIRRDLGWAPPRRLRQALAEMVAAG